jgi:hypothetical protein
MNIYVLLDEVHDTIQLSRTVAIRLIEQSSKLEEKIGSYLEEQEEYLQEDAEIIPLKPVDTETTEWHAQALKQAINGDADAKTAQGRIVATPKAVGTKVCLQTTLEDDPRQNQEEKEIKALLVEGQGTEKRLPKMT